MRASLPEIFKRRASLFVFGDRDGVSLNHLSKTTDGVFLNIQSIVKFEKDLPKQMLTHLPKADTLFKKTVSSQKKVTNARWNAESNLFSLLYSLVCSSKSKTIIETGVANGISTNAIMKGLELSHNIGVLHSFDILPETSNAYKGAGNWQFHLLSERSTHKHLKRIVSKLPQVDIWLHDSNHGYRWQKFEFLLAWGRLKKGGFLISDDVDASPAWAELSKTVFRKSYIVFDSRKFIGIAIK